MKLALIIFILTGSVGFLVALFVWFVISAPQQIQEGGNRTQTPPPEKPTRTFIFNQNVFTVEVVTGAEAIKRGLSGRDSLPKDRGMLFVFSKLGNYPFWMRGMQFPLDIIWMRNGIVVDMAKNMPAPHRWEWPASYRPKASADMVLELNAGEIQENGIKEGQKIL